MQIFQIRLIRDYYSKKGIVRKLKTATGAHSSVSVVVSDHVLQHMCTSFCEYGSTLQHKTYIVNRYCREFLFFSVFVQYKRQFAAQSLVILRSGLYLFD